MVNANESWFKSQTSRKHNLDLSHYKVDQRHSKHWLIYTPSNTEQHLHSLLVESLATQGTKVQ